MTRKFLLSWLVVFIIWMVGSFVVHGLLLADGYSRLPQLFRTEEETAGLTHFMLIAHVIMAGAFVWIYQRGAEAKPWLAQGLRFGIAIALLAPVPTYTIYYVVQPMPGAFVLQQMLFDSALVVVLALATAFLNRSTSTDE